MMLVFVILVLLLSIIEPKILLIIFAPIAIYNVRTLIWAWKLRQNDPVESCIRIVLNGVVLMVMIILLLLIH